MSKKKITKTVTERSVRSDIDSPRYDDQREETFYPRPSGEKHVQYEDKGYSDSLRRSGPSARTRDDVIEDELEGYARVERR